MADKTGVGNLFDLAGVPLRVDSVLDDTDVVDFQPQFVAGLATDRAKIDPDGLDAVKTRERNRRTREPGRAFGGWFRRTEAADHCGRVRTGRSVLPVIHDLLPRRGDMRGECFASDAACRGGCGVPGVGGAVVNDFGEFVFGQSVSEGNLEVDVQFVGGP
jgi:hypothetical protein